MTLKILTCAMLMSSALLMGGAAYADTMVGSTAVSDKDLPAVQERCDQLNTAATTESITDETMGDDSTAGGTDATIASAEKVNELEAATTTVDLDNITLESCKDAGLIQ